jgi:hypothetical protein
MNALRAYVLRLKFAVRSTVAREPGLALLHRPVIWWQQYKILRYYRRHGATIRDCVVGAHTDFVLDGFQGSGNSFAAAAVERSQERSVQLAHHMHAPAQIIAGVRRGLPTLVTLRPPTGAVASLTSRWPYVTLPQALRCYARFYRKIEPYAEGFVISPFAKTTGALGEVIRTVNQRFGTDFAPFEHTEENMRALRPHGEPRSEEERARQARKAEKKAALQRPACRKPLAEAQAVHRRMTQRAETN